MTTMTATATLTSETYEVSDADFASTRRDILAAGGTITTSVFTPTGYRMTAVFPA